MEGELLSEEHLKKEVKRLREVVAITSRNCVDQENKVLSCALRALNAAWLSGDNYYTPSTLEIVEKQSEAIQMLSAYLSECVKLLEHNEGLTADQWQDRYEVLLASLKKDASANLNHSLTKLILN